MAQRFDWVERIRKAVPAGGLRHELGDARRPLGTHGASIETAFLPDRAGEKFNWQGVVRCRFLQARTNLVRRRWMRGFSRSGLSRRRCACLCQGTIAPQGERTREQRSGQSDHVDLPLSSENAGVRFDLAIFGSGEPTAAICSFNSEKCVRFPCAQYESDSRPTLMRVSAKMSCPQGQLSQPRWDARILRYRTDHVQHLTIFMRGTQALSERLRNWACALGKRKVGWSWKVQRKKLRTRRPWETWNVS
jgi:hypothetical protein